MIGLPAAQIRPPEGPNRHLALVGPCAAHLRQRSCKRLSNKRRYGVLCKEPVEES